MKKMKMKKPLFCLITFLFITSFVSKGFAQVSAQEFGRAVFEMLQKRESFDHASKFFFQPQELDALIKIQLENPKLDDEIKSMITDPKEVERAKIKIKLALEKFQAKWDKYLKRIKDSQLSLIEIKYRLKTDKKENLDYYNIKIRFIRNRFDQIIRMTLTLKTILIENKLRIINLD